jgi:methyl-accepting chemotaxis protein
MEQLNATVRANARNSRRARDKAGDAGKGFAVVAQEVRNLAQRAAPASRDIKALILSSDDRVKEGVELVQKAGGALNGSAGNVDEVASLIGEIAEAAGNQATALARINAAVTAMEGMTQKKRRPGAGDGRRCPRHGSANG